MLSVPDVMIAYQRTPGPQADRDVQRVQDAMIDLCENLKDRFAILDMPPTKDIEEVRKWRRRLELVVRGAVLPVDRDRLGRRGADACAAVGARGRHVSRAAIRRRACTRRRPTRSSRAPSG